MYAAGIVSWRLIKLILSKMAEMYGMMMEGFSSNPVYTGSCYSMG